MEENYAKKLNIKAILRNQLSQIEFLRFHKFFAYFQQFISSHFLSHSLSPTLTFCLILSFSFWLPYLSFTSPLSLSLPLSLSVSSCLSLYFASFSLSHQASFSVCLKFDFWQISLILSHLFLSFVYVRSLSLSVLRSLLTLFLSLSSLSRCPTPSEAEIAFEFLESCHSF